MPFFALFTFILVKKHLKKALPAMEVPLFSVAFVAFEP